MIEKTIEELLAYAEIHLDLKQDDKIYFRNLLIRKLKATAPYDGDIDYDHIKSLNVPDELVDKLSRYILENNLVEQENLELFLTELLGDLTPLPSVVNAKFNDLYNESDIKALDYLYDLSIKNNYIQKTKVDKNILWYAEFPDNSVEISINLSKPEKNNKDIKKLLTAKTTSKYPQCLLCKENVGFAGNSGHPARENLRIIPLNLAGERWYIQYSPYVYYDHHCIVFNDRHANMHIDHPTFEALFDFVDIFPSFFIGSNSDLPIVGGSILNHEHFQGGKHILPMLKSNVRKEYYTINGVKVSSLDWYNTVVLLEGSNKTDMVKVADKVLDVWKEYSDESNDIIAYTTERHNTITPIVQKTETGFRMFLILRNNRTNEQYPDGIFHAHPEYHMIKKEGIGLIEAMGLFILPARLQRQFRQIAEVKKENLSHDAILERYEDLKDFLPMIDELKGIDLTEEIKNYVNNVCRNILINTGVFKNTKDGQLGLDKFLEEVRVKYE